MLFKIVFLLHATKTYHCHMLPRRRPNKRERKFRGNFSGLQPPIPLPHLPPHPGASHPIPGSLLRLHPGRRFPVAVFDNFSEISPAQAQVPGCIPASTGNPSDVITALSDPERGDDATCPLQEPLRESGVVLARHTCEGGFYEEEEEEGEKDGAQSEKRDHFK